jgi:hypothetical protein
MSWCAFAPVFPGWHIQMSCERNYGACQENAVVEVAREVVAPKCAKFKTSEGSSVMVGVTQPQLQSREWRGTSMATHYSLF